MAKNLPLIGAFWQVEKPERSKIPVKSLENKGEEEPRAFWNGFQDDCRASHIEWPLIIKNNCSFMSKNGCCYDTERFSSTDYIHSLCLIV